MAFPTLVSSTGGKFTTANTISYALTFGFTANAGDLIVVAASIDGSAGTNTLSWSAGWVELDDFDSGSFNYGVAYLIAAGGETGVTITSSAQNDHWAALIWRFSGAGVPTLTRQNPTASATPDPPTNTPAGGSKDYFWIAGYSVDTGPTQRTNTADPAGYTNPIESREVSTTGSQMRGASRSATGASENPAAFTLNGSETWVAFTIAVPPGGPVTQFGVVARAIAFGQQIAARRQTFSAAAQTLAFGAAVAGIASVPAVTHFGASSLTATFGAVAQGRRRTTGQVAATLTLARAVQAQRRTTGQVARPTGFAAAVAGQRRTFAASSQTVALGAVTAGIGFKPAVTYFGASSLTATFGAASAGRRRTTGQVAVPLGLARAVQAQRRTFAATARPFGFAAAVTGQRRTFSATVSPIGFGAAVAGFVPAATLYGAVSGTFTLATASAGRRGALGVVARPVGFGAAVSGSRRTTGQVARSITFAAASSARRGAFGVVARPVGFAAAVTARKQTFGVVARPTTLLVVTEGLVQPVIATQFGAVALPVTVTAAVAARRRTFTRSELVLVLGESTAARRGSFGRFALTIGLGAGTAARRQTFAALEAEFRLELVASYRAPAALLSLGLADATLVRLAATDAAAGLLAMTIADAPLLVMTATDAGLVVVRARDGLYAVKLSCSTKKPGPLSAPAGSVVSQR